MRCFWQNARISEVISVRLSGSVRFNMAKLDPSDGAASTREVRTKKSAAVALSRIRMDQGACQSPSERASRSADIPAGGSEGRVTRGPSFSKMKNGDSCNSSLRWDASPVGKPALRLTAGGGKRMRWCSSFPSRPHSAR
jgi:hypothetical protein